LFDSVQRLVKLFQQPLKHGDSRMAETIDFPAKAPRAGRKSRSSSRVDKPAGAATTGKISMREVARLAKVSVATVSMVLNDNPRISRATHMKVQRLIERLGYRPNRLAQSLSGRYTQEE
jgi:LacI family transcriptional regulator